ncbi:unnamed protein product [Rotaria sp. Silwood2]|nr:unnamed protein product [Rotaria sp. Silwood2]
MIMDLFRSVQILHLTVEIDENSAYLDANKWQQLIICHMPNLRIFDIRYNIYLRSHSNLHFGLNGNGFFSHNFYLTRYGNDAIFYSTNPYRRKYYTLYQSLGETTLLLKSESHLDSVRHVDIQSGQSIINGMSYFPNATELTFHDALSTTRASIVSILNRIISLKKLIQLAIECDRFSIQKVIKILCCAPNLNTIKLKSMLCYKKSNDYTSIKESNDFRQVSKTNTVTNVICTIGCTLDQIQLLVALCPRMKHLSIGGFMTDIESITRFLLNKTNQNTRYLCLLCFSGTPVNAVQRLDILMKSERLLYDYLLRKIDCILYLWW